MAKSKLPPGPRFAPLNTYRFIRNIDKLARDCVARYGDPFTISTFIGRLVITGQPDGIKELFTAPPDDLAPFGNGPLEPIVGANSLLLLAGARHRRERKLLMPPFHGERMRAYGRLMQDIALRAAARWRPGERVVMQDAMQHITFDIIMRAVFGVDDGERVARFQAANDRAIRAVKPAYLFVPALQHRVLPGWRRFLAARDEWDGLLRDQVERRRRDAGPHEDILGLLLDARDENGSPMSDVELRDELQTMLGAGHETTAVALSWALFWLHRDRAVLARLLDELAPLGPTPDPEALAKLPWLGAVCDETLRIRAVAPIAPRILRAPLTVRGWELPAGTIVLASLHLAHANPDVFPAPHEFRPQRFLERKFTPFEYLPYGGGARRCLGAAFASYEMRIVLGSLVARHRLALVSDAVPRTIRRNITLGPQGGIPMIHEGARDGASATAAVA